MYIYIKQIRKAILDRLIIYYGPGMSARLYNRADRARNPLTLHQMVSQISDSFEQRGFADNERFEEIIYNIGRQRMIKRSEVRLQLGRTNDPRLLVVPPTYAEMIAGAKTDGETTSPLIADDRRSAFTGIDDQNSTGEALYRPVHDPYAPSLSVTGDRGSAPHDVVSLHDPFAPSNMATTIAKGDISSFIPEDVPNGGAPPRIGGHSSTDQSVHRPIIDQIH